MHNIQKLASLGQSVWLDNIQRSMLENGEFKSMIERGEIRGMTSNPTIFNHAIAKTGDYDEAITSLSRAGWDPERIFWELAVEDIRDATDLFLPLYQQTNAGDGYVSIEVSPYLAGDTEATTTQARKLWDRVSRPNLMVKIPATAAGIPAIRQAISAGMNINVTLIFSRSRYREVMDAYMSGLEDRVAAGYTIDRVASVASFFISRIDTKVDDRLPQNSPLRGKLAIANARLAYSDFLKMFSGDRWERLKRQGGQMQRPLWASTSTKNPGYLDTLYVDNLVGAHTVNTMPLKTLQATQDHARVEITVTQDLDNARETLNGIEAAGVSLDQTTRELEIEGVQAFADAITDLFKTIEDRRRNAVQALGPLHGAVEVRVRQLEADSIVKRMWATDASLWTRDPAARSEVSSRMGWLRSPEKAHLILPSLKQFASRIREAGIRKVLVLGMGGSSLTADVLNSMFSGAKSSSSQQQRDALDLEVLDSTDPEQVAVTAREYPPAESLYIVSSKSGATREVSALAEYFWSQANGDGSRFIAITDANTPLEQLARQRAFRAVFTADETVGGRYSALSAFGLVPAALLGIDLDRLLERAGWMQRQCGPEVPTARNPGFSLGAVLGEAALSGRDKLTLLADAPVAALANWIEQLVAESTGKDGRGIVPVPSEHLNVPRRYGRDRIFLYLRQSGELDVDVQQLREAGFPTIVILIPDSYNVGAEFYRWEMAVAVCCHILGINAFDQPDVQASKERTKARILEYHSTGKIVEGKWDIQFKGKDLGKDGKRKILAFVDHVQPGDYVAINAYLPRNPSTEEGLQKMRVAIGQRTGSAVTAGFGPRFEHSTGQLHKGGPNSGLFIQLVNDTTNDLPIPGENLTFGTLIHAQALSDYETLVARGRRTIRVHLSKPSDIAFLVEAFQ